MSNLSMTKLLVRCLRTAMYGIEDYFGGDYKRIPEDSAMYKAYLANLDAIIELNKIEEALEEQEAEEKE